MIRFNALCCWSVAFINTLFSDTCLCLLSTHTLCSAIAVQYKWACSAQLPHHKQAWWKNITSMPATMHQDIISASFAPLRPGDEVPPHTSHSWNAFPGWLFPVRDYSSAARLSCLARELVDQEKAWPFPSLTKHFYHLSLIFLFSLQDHLWKRESTPSPPSFQATVSTPVELCLLFLRS